MSRFRASWSVALLLLAPGIAPGQQSIIPVVAVHERQPEISSETLARLASMGGDPRDFKVWLYFRDKGVTEGAALSAVLDATEASLDPHAAARRAKVFGPRLVDAYDLPVHAGYLERVEELGATLLHESRWLNAVSARGSLAALHEIAALPFVRKITFVAVGRRSPPPAPPLPPLPPGPDRTDHTGRLTFDYGPSRDQLEEINVFAAHRRGLSGAGVRIAFLDTGYWRDHPCFQRLLADRRLIAQWDFINGDAETQDEPGDPAGQHNHGTSTLSLVAGFQEGELIGTAYDAQILLAKTEDVSSETPVEEDYWVAGAEWAERRGADVLSSSLSYIAWYDYSDMDGETAVTTIAADLAASRGVVVCVAAGNWGTQDWYYIGAPADGDLLLAVGASQPDGSMWDDSSHGPTFDGRVKPEVVARGALTYTAVVPGGHGGTDLFRYLDGTSMACPLVAGAAALVLEAHPTWTPAEVRDALIRTADNYGSPDDHRGYGRIDVTAAID